MRNAIRYTMIISLIIVVFTSCQEKHFLKEKSYRNQVKEQFDKRKEEAVSHSEALFSVLDRKDLSIEQKEALEFLYAYMPITDLADYDGEFYLKNVNAAFKARDYFSWGKNIPDDIFRHFVLVHRVNNEYLDTARIVFFEELKGRVKNLSMYEAALEVNHWCHEKVTYRATDGRTSAPLALMKTSWGRCGEESTFTTIAMRAVGIPARQCYTPRWAHTDSNHAWVEVWIDGEWHYLGACEPEAELDFAWFTAPAKRGMMVHTNVFGLYTGPEEKNVETPLYSKINLLENYAKTRKVKIKVVDKNNNPVEGAKISYNVFNYAALYPITDGFTDKNGSYSVISGMGDLLVWAKKGNLYGYIKSTPEDDMVTLVMDKEKGKEYVETFTMNVPPEQQVKELSPEKIAQNAIRLAHEDSIRNAYMATFATEVYAADLAENHNLNPSEVWNYLYLAQGNWKEIENFIVENKDNPFLFTFLSTLYEKDLRDTPAAILNDHFKDIVNIKAQPVEYFHVEYILSPRIALELIQPWRSYFQQEAISSRFKGGINDIIHFINTEIDIKDEENYYNCSLTPRGAYELKISDSRSRDILFVALCRSMHIPARIESATAKPQYFENGKWFDVSFTGSDNVSYVTPKALITISSDKSNVTKPNYGTHYSLSYFQDGEFKVLSLRGNSAIKEFPYTLELNTGYYRLLTASRANDGSVTITNKYFNLSEGDKKKETIKLPEPEGKLFVKGIIDMNTIVEIDGNKRTLKELANGKGLMLCFIDPAKEPSKHILQDLPAVRDGLEAWNGGILIMTPDDKINNAFTPSSFRGLPGQIQWGIDENRSLLNTVADILQVQMQDNFPFTIYLNNNGGVLYSTAGYKIGVGEDILRTIKMENESK